MTRAPRRSTISTFSVVARDPGTGDLGVATASKFLAVGAVVPYAEAGRGAVATQSYANTTLGPRTMMAIRGGISLDLIHQAFAESDAQHAQRQYGLVDAGGNSLTFTGDDCHPWAGGKRGENYAVQGNLLTGPEVVEGLEQTFLNTEGALPERLLAALAAGDSAGGDKRGRQSAALLVVREAGGYGGFNDRYIDLRVDDHPQPVGELRRLLDLQRLFFERPQEDEILEIGGELAERLQSILVRSGYLTDVRGSWDDASESALRDLIGTENLEERTVDVGYVDQAVVRYLEEKYSNYRK